MDLNINLRGGNVIKHNSISKCIEEASAVKEGNIKEYIEREKLRK